MSDDTMTSDTTESGNLTVTDAASAIEGMLSAPEDSTEEQPEVVEEQTEEVEEVEETETEPEVEEEVESETEEEVEEESEVEEPEEVEEEQTFTIKAAGEEKEVTLDELKKSYQLGSDYTKKTQEVAEQRKIIEQEAKAIIEARQVRDNYSQKLQAIEQFLTGQNDNPAELAAMKENDPVGYAVKVAEMTEKKEQLQTVQAERARLAQEQQTESQAQMQKFVEQEAQKLAESLPEFSDKTKGEQIRNDIRSYGKKVGFTDEELSQVYDSRHVLVLHKAAQYDKLMAGKAGVKKKVAKAPKTVKSGAKVKQNVTDIQKKQLKKLQQTGSARDAAAIFENFI
jgi:DNA repair exonuclease SbcCD ATPase subunit